MDIFTGSPTSDLHVVADRSAYERMEIAYKDAAREELTLRAALEPEQLRRQLVKAERHHRDRFKRTGDTNCLRWADKLKGEVEAL
jgi:hypothetical protein